MSSKKTLPFGLFPSPISPLMMGRSLTFAEVGLSSEGYLLWLENRSDRGVIVVQPLNGEGHRDLNSEISVRAKVGYGGGDFSVQGDDVFFVAADSGRIYRQSVECGRPYPITPAFGNAAHPVLSADGRYLAFVHTYEGKDVIAFVPSDGSRWPINLIGGNDFYMQPTWHPDGRRFAWITWDHPNMPWDGTSLWLGEIDFNAGKCILQGKQLIAGGVETAIFQPLFSPDGRYLAYISDQNNWWQIYLYDLESQTHQQLTFAEAEDAVPAWVQGIRTYQFSADGQRIYLIRNQNGYDSLWKIDCSSGMESQIQLDQPYSLLSQIQVTSYEQQDLIALIASSAQIPPRVITVTPHGKTTIHGRSYPEDIPNANYAPAQPISWQGMDGETVFGIYYPPHNPEIEGRGKPPLIVHIHGGPTSQAKNGFNPRAQYFATRGYAFLEVNYRGSTGYGRIYRNKLRLAWGIYDVQDAVSGAKALVEKGWVDSEKLVIMGGSAGGFTVLKALEDFPHFFKAGVCLYGVSNHFTLAQETHKFEARYLDSLLGALPEAAQVYRERSPINYVARIQDALAIFQGEEDKVVPKAQSDSVVETLGRRGVPVVYHVYAGEGHGFRKSETIEHFYRAVEDFLREKVLFS
ncbi:MAG: prolyl oligopeptidase family serine peptidase [Anaerolineales bacterium]